VTPHLVAALLAACAAGLAVAALGTLTDRRVRSRLAALLPPEAPPRRPARVAAAPRSFAREPANGSRRVVNRRRRLVDRHVLEFVELLVAATEAGMPPAAAVQRSATLVRGPLGDELKRAGREIALGVDWRAALEHVCSRTQASSLRKLMSTLARAHRLGTSAQGSLRAIADELRLEQRVHAEEVARKAPVKMLFPLVFLILPAFLLLTVGPVLLATIRSLH
jgi:pilus assembly protein TadC